MKNLSLTPYRFERINSSMRRASLSYKAQPIQSGQFRNRSQNVDKFREQVRSVLAQVPELMDSVPADYHAIPKEVFGNDHWCYYFSAKVPTLDNKPVTVEFHVDPTDGFCEVYVEDTNEGTLFDHFQCEDIEDFSPAEIDRISTAISGSAPAAVTASRRSPFQRW